MSILTDEITITQDFFNELFPKDPDLYYLLTSKPATEQELIKYYLPSKLWRLNNLYTITDKVGDKVPFRLNFAQFKVHAALQQHARLIILKSRQQGISTYYLINFFDDAIFKSFLNIGLMAQGVDEAVLLLEKVKFAWDHFDESIKEFLGRKQVRSSAKQFKFNNDSTIFVRTSFRSATLQRLHVSEYGKISNESPKKAKETKTGTLQTIKAGNPVAIESTAEGHNDFKIMWDQAVLVEKTNRKFAGKDFKPLFLSWIEDPTCVEEEDQIPNDEAINYFTYLESLGIELTREQKNFWIVQYRELGGDIYQEYPASPDEAFRAGRDGTYWAKKYMEFMVRRGHRKPKLFDRNLDVFVTVDSGIHDYFVFNFWQVWENQIRIIGEFWNQGEGLKYYANYLLNELPKEWRIGKIYLPHDFAVRDISNAEGKTRQEVWADMGITNTRLLGKQDLASSIEVVRSELPNIYIDEGCTYLESCFLNYAKKWDPRLLKWLDSPVKNQYCHGADTIRYMCQAVTEYHRSPDHGGSGQFVVGGVAL